MYEEKDIFVMKSVTKIAVAMAIILAIGAYAPAAAQSAKFAAVWNDEPVIAEVDPGFASTVEIAEIHIPQQKELLIGVSAQIGIITITDAKGNNDTDAVALASGEATVTVLLVDQATGDVIATAPGPVVFASRLQELRVSVEDEDEDLSVLVGLTLDTTAAHHFNFLGVDLPQGNYDVVAQFDLTAFAEATGLDPTDADAVVSLGPRVVTAQEVRAVKGSIIEP